MRTVYFPCVGMRLFLLNLFFLFTYIFFKKKIPSRQKKKHNETLDPSPSTMFKNNKKDNRNHFSLKPAEQHYSMTTILKNTLPLFAKAVGSPVLSLVQHSPLLSLQEKNETAGSINNHLMENTNG